MSRIVERLSTHWWPWSRTLVAALLWLYVLSTVTVAFTVKHTDQYQVSQSEHQVSCINRSRVEIRQFLTLTIL